MGPIEVGALFAGVGALVTPQIIEFYNNGLAEGATNEEYIDNIPSRTRRILGHVGVALLGAISSGTLGVLLGYAISRV